jgi:hypothetical protein
MMSTSSLAPVVTRYVGSAGIEFELMKMVSVQPVDNLTVKTLQCTLH